MKRGRETVTVDFSKKLVDEVGEKEMAGSDIGGPVWTPDTVTEDEPLENVSNFLGKEQKSQNVYRSA